MRVTLRLYALLWIATGLAAGVVAVVPGLDEFTRGGLQLTLAAGGARTFGTVLAIAAHNAIVAGYPIALERLGLGRDPRSKNLFGCVIAAGLLANASLVGAALGAYGPQLVPFLVHLPVEWAALVVGGGAWFRSSTGPPRGVIVALAIAVLAAAVIEAFVTP